MRQYRCLIKSYKISGYVTIRHQLHKMDKEIPKAQAQDVSYELHTLGWKAFQELCITITSEILGQTVQNYLTSKDGGRDGAFSGKWNLEKGGVEGSFTIQCKYSSNKDNKLKISALTDELNKAEKLAKKGLADNYIIITNYQITGKADEEIKKAFESIEGIRNCVVLGAEWITLKFTRVHD